MSPRTTIGAWFAFLLLSGSPANASGPVNFSAGEHGAYSRVVLSKGAGAAQIVQNGRVVSIALATPPDQINLSALTAGRRTERVSRAQAFPTSGGSLVILDLNCDCRMEEMRLANGKTVIDIHPASRVTADSQSGRAVAAPTPLTPAPTPASEPNKPKTAANAKTAVNVARQETATKEATTEDEQRLSVENARSRMLELLQQAASEGLISLRDNENSPSSADDESQSATIEQPGGKPARKPAPFDPDALAKQIQVRKAAPVEKANNRAFASPSQQCLDDEVFALHADKFDEDPLKAISDLQALLPLSEYNTRRGIAEDLANGFIAIGFGEEAVATLKDYSLTKSVKYDMALALAEMPVPKNGPLLGASDCAGAHSLWKAAALQPEDAIGPARRSGDAVTGLPTRLKTQIATRIAKKLVTAEEWDEAKRFFKIASRSTDVYSPDLTFVEAKLREHKGDADGAEDVLLSLVAENSQTADEALLELAENYLDGDTPHEEYLTDIGALAHKTRGSETGARAAILEGVAYANDNQIMASVMLLHNAAERRETDMQTAVTEARRVIADGVQKNNMGLRIESISAFLRYRDFIDEADGDIEFSRTVAQAALDIGLPNVAFKVIENSPAPDRSDYALLKTDAALAAGAPDQALASAAPFAGEAAFAERLVKANLRLQNNYAALAAAAGLPPSEIKNTLTAQSAWRAGEWRTALRAFAAMDPADIAPETAIQYGLAAYMSGAASMPSAVDAVLREDDHQALEGLRSLFAAAPGGSVLARGKAAAQSAGDEITLIEETLGNG